MGAEDITIPVTDTYIDENGNTVIVGFPDIVDPGEDTNTTVDRETGPLPGGLPND